MAGVAPAAVGVARLRVGAAAAVALALVPPALLGFGLAVADAAARGAHGGAWNGFLPLPAAVALLAGGVMLLYLRHRADMVQGGVGALGLSVGGEHMLEAAPGNPALAAVVSDGAGERSVKETLTGGWKAALAIPEAVAQTSALAVFSAHPPPPSLTSVAPRISPRAAFSIDAQHGVGGEDLNRTFYDRAHEPPWRVLAAGLRATPHQYEQRVVAFLLDHLRRSGTSARPTSERRSP